MPKASGVELWWNCGASCFLRLKLEPNTSDLVIKVNSPEFEPSTKNNLFYYPLKKWLAKMMDPRQNNGFLQTFMYLVSCFSKIFHPQITPLSNQHLTAMGGANQLGSHLEASVGLLGLHWHIQLLLYASSHLAGNHGKSQPKREVFSDSESLWIYFL